MKGLLTKDICLMAGRKQSLVLFVIIGFVMGFSMDGAFVVGYMSMLTVIFLIGSVSYDEFDNGYPFLFTLPVTRRSYVNEKYVFVIGGGVIGILIGMLIGVSVDLMKGLGFSPEYLETAVTFVPFVCIIAAVSLPIQLKYGAEKSRIVIAVLGGSVLAISALGAKFMPDLDLAVVMDRMSVGVIAAVAVVIAVVATAVSYAASLNIVNNKEF